MKQARAGHWIGIGAALIPIPFEIRDVMRLRLWDADWWILPATAIYAIAVSLLVYWIARALVKLIGKLLRSR